MPENKEKQGAPTLEGPTNSNMTVRPAKEQQDGPRYRKMVAWVCSMCEKECVPVRLESRCLCGHRLRDHKLNEETEQFECCTKNCVCENFFFIVTEGTWILRCRCKHKHTQHDALTHTCTLPMCNCEGFDSPWVCNCDHPWSAHRQIVVNKKVITIADMIAKAEALDRLENISNNTNPSISIAPEINNWDSIKRGR